MLIFNLKKEWFEKIKNGEKTHEYREYKPYWAKRLSKYFATDLSAIKLRFGNEIVFSYPYYVSFACGYPSANEKDKILKARVQTIRLIDGRETDLKKAVPVYDIKFELIKD